MEVLEGFATVMWVDSNGDWSNRVRLLRRSVERVIVEYERVVSGGLWFVWKEDSAADSRDGFWMNGEEEARCLFSQ